MNLHTEQKIESEANKPEWQRPRLEYLGTIGDFVQGGGKSGTNSDHDPLSTTKGGVG